MKRCKNCLMASTKPGLKLDNEGVCQACRNYKLRENINYEKRFEELRKISKKYKRGDGYYDCLIAVSGGKDSHFQVYTMKEVLGMNPLLISVSDPFTKTKAGQHNIENITKTFGCDIITLNINPSLIQKMVKIAFETLGSPTWPIDRAIYCYPIRMAINMKIPLVIYGENVSYEYGGVLEEETYSAKDQINNDVAKKINFDLWIQKGITRNELNMLNYPSSKEINKATLDPIYLSYFLPWDGNRNYQIAKRYGFHDLTHEWNRKGYIEDYDQIDSIAYLMNVWMKYPKFGFCRATDVVGYWIRSGQINRQEGIELIKRNDKELDPKILEDFLNFTGYSDKEFWNIVDKFWNTELFDNVNGIWQENQVIQSSLSN